MSEALLANEGTLRIAFFAAVLFLMALLEALFPRRPREISRLFRWSNNFAIVVLDSVLVKLFFPLLAVAAALLAEDRGWGFFNLPNLSDVPVWLAVVFTILILDLSIYAQHVLFHIVPPLWRLHRVHHTDLDFDVTTGIRFHPIEILLSMAIKLVFVILLGPPAVAVLVFEILLNASAMFNHSNLKIPLAFDRVIRLFMVTPDMHRVHHSVLPHETNSNYGFFLPWWDRMFGTYIDQPEKGHEGMTIGIEEFRTQKDMRLDQLLLQPLRTGGIQKQDSVHD